MTKFEMIKQVLSATLTVAMVLGIGYGTYVGYLYVSERASPEAGEAAEIRMPVDVGVVTRTDMEHRINIFATVAPDEGVDLKPKVTGRLVRLSLDDGTSTTIGTVVKKGEVVAALERREFEAKVEYAQGVYENAKAALQVSKNAGAVARVNLVDAERELLRQQDLKERNAGTMQTLDKAVTERDRCKLLVAQAEAAHEQLEAALKQADASLKQAKIDLDETDVRAPFDGIITDKLVGHGAMVSPTTPLVTVVNHYIIKVKMAVPQEYLKYIVKDVTPVRMTANLWDKPFNDTVYRSYPALDPTSRTSIVEVRTKNFKLPDGNWAFRPEMFLEGSILIGTRPNAVALPMDVLVPMAGDYLVFIVEGDRVKRRTVKVGIRQGALVEITEGLEGGETIVMNGQFMLTDGAAVNIRNTEK